jgi:polysaccharide biosynthesis protein PslH
VRADVPDVAEVFADADVAVFPDRNGLGVRNSVTEALAAGLPVVATPAAAREQQPQPLLRIGGTPQAIAALAATALITRARREPAPTRSWSTVAGEYLDELDAARGAIAATL